MRSAKYVDDDTDEEFKKLKKVLLTCKPFNQGCATIVCVRCFKLLAFPSGASRIKCGACDACCSSVQAKCVSCGHNMKIPLGAKEVQCSDCRYTFQPMATMRVKVPEEVANSVPPPISLQITLADSVGFASTTDFKTRVILSKPLSTNIGAFELQSGARFHKVQFFKMESDGDEKKLEAGRTPIELNLKSGDKIEVRGPSTKKENENGDDSHACGAGAGTSTHDFQVTQFSSPTNCAACSGFIFGVYKQGKKCVRCNMAVHHRCAEEKSSTMCDAARRMMFGITDFADFNSDSDDDNRMGDAEEGVAVVVAVPVDDPTAFYNCCEEELSPECDPNKMSKLSRLADFDDAQISDMWQKYDKDSSGVLEKAEALDFLSDIVKSFGMDPNDASTDEVLARLLRRLDTNEDGVVSWDEFWFFFNAQKDIAFLQQFAGSQEDFSTEQLYEMWNKFDADGSGVLEADEVIRLLSDITHTDEKTLKMKKNKNMLSSFLKEGQPVTWDIFYESFVPIIQDAVKNAKKQ